MKKHIAIIMLVIFASACAGKQKANPVAAYQYGDEKMSCSGLQASIADIDVRVIEVQEEDKTTGQNTAAAVVGAIIFWPALFALDFSDDEKIEIAAYRRRRESLRRIMVEKGCPVIPVEMKIAEAEEKEKPPESPKTASGESEDDY